MLSHVQLYATPWTIGCQAPLSMEFSRQEYWSGLPFPTPGDFSNPVIKPTSLVSPVLAAGLFTTALPGKPINWTKCSNQKTLTEYIQKHDSYIYFLQETNLRPRDTCRLKLR